MKTKEEIEKEIEACKKTIANYHESYKANKIPEDVLLSGVNQNEAILTALSWVLGENDRWD
jgi:hypothetical protein